MRQFLFLLATLPFLLCEGCGGTAAKIPVHDMQPGKRIKVLNAGDSINTLDNEYAPSFDAHSQVLFFNRHRVGGISDIYRVDVESTVEDYRWGTIDTVLASEYRDGSITFSADGRRVIFVSCDRPLGAGNCDLYEVADFGSASMEIRNLNMINTEDWEGSPALSSDGHTLYFTTMTHGMKNGSAADEKDSDIYITRVDGEEFWSMPTPLDAPINSEYREDGAYLTNGDSVLYFASDRPGGYGGFDLYVSFRQADGTWGPIYNLGPEINTRANEHHITMTADGNTVFFSSNRLRKGKFGDFDIYVARFVP